MKPYKSPIVVSALIASVATISSAATEGEYSSRWELMAQAYASVEKTLGNGSDTNAKLATLNTKMARFKVQCNLLAKIERATCLDDLTRLTTMATTAANPDDETRNQLFPTNIPNFVSPEMKKIMVNWTPFWLAPGWEGFPDSGDYGAWQTLHDEVIDPATRAGEALLDSLNVTTEEREIGGVRTVVVNPSENRHPGKVLIHVHGGAFYANTPETTFDRTAPLSNLMGIDIVSVDYKLMPSPGWDILDQRDQVISVFDALIGEGGGYAPEDVGVYGCSAGGGLVAMATNEMSHRGGPIPAAAVTQSPQTDFTLDSDSNWTLRYDDPRTQVDLLIQSVWPMLGITEEKALDPRYSPALDDYSGREMPPTMVQVGTKETQMSDGIRYYDVVRRGGHVTQLDAHDAMQHCFHGHWGTPEAEVAVSRVAEWFGAHLYKE
ncbi:alpha/beta hydrolase [Ruegeria litorea]|uniref:Alpha/beta hydrolase n=1 Tax=Falsiruegeria litorea TaxID=1280831 RepID=A0ABS5WK98_9RHOB|nr:alpha/beta hydrolase [Falsiruegeria litorea]MBT3139481.1 alpha/beta hydrolase [Falsiruegeria litorea]